MRWYSIVTLTAWSALIGCLWLWYYRSQSEDMMELARTYARAAHARDLSYRNWNATRGGVYVAVTDSTRPNPYLHVPERDITTPSGRSLTLVNPATMTRQVHEAARQLGEGSSHITSLKPLNPVNVPDEWEKRALAAFEAGEKEISTPIDEHGKPALRLMRPLYVESSCLACHATQGYQVGDVRGGISVTVPVSSFWAVQAKQLRTVSLGYGVVWLMGCLGIVAAGNRIGRRIVECERAKEAIQQEKAFSDAVIQSLPGIFFVLDREGRCIRWNRLLEEQLGIPPERIRGMSSLPFTSEEDRSLLADRMAEIIEQGPAHAEGCGFLRGDTILHYYFSGGRMNIGGNDCTVVTGINVTEQKHAERALRESEELFRRVIETSPDAIALLDPCGRFLMANEKTALLAGFESVDELLSGGVGAFDLLATEDRQRAQEDLRDMIETGNPKTDEYRVMRRDGRSVIVEINGSVLRDPSGHPKAMVAVIRDVTERRETEQALQRERVFVNAVLDSVAGLLYVYDEQGYLVRWNKKHEELTGYSAEELAHMHVLDWYKGNEIDTAVISEGVRRALVDGHAEAEANLITKCGATIPFHFTAVRMVVDGKNYFTGIGTDITERKRAEEMLQESEGRYSSVIEATNDWVWETDPEGFYTYASPHVREVLGFEPEEILGRTPFDFMSPSEAERARSAIGAIFAQRKPFRGLEQVSQDRNGNVVILETNGVPIIDATGNFCGYRGMDRNVTDRKRVREALQKAKEAAESANRAKSEFLANMSHEIRTPLTAILGYADIMLEHPASALALDAAATIRRNGDHLLQIISDILDISKIEADRLKPEYAMCSPEQLVQEVVSLMKVRADSKRLNLTADFERAIPAVIETDPLRLRQILVNLVGNAIKFTDRGSVRLMTRLILDGHRKPKLQIDVIDTGLGLDENQIAMLFQPFTQVDGCASRRFGGSGLGLAISRRLAGLLGGDVSVTSVPGQGSTFSVTVAVGSLNTKAPFVAPAAPRISPELDEARLACRILLAEDGTDNQRLISFVLTNAGADVTVAENGQLAVDCVLAAHRDGRPFDLILMDIQMPVMNGYDATARLRQEGFRGPIIALTAHAMPEDREKCLHAGCDGHLTKPIAPKELAKSLGRYLRKSEHDGKREEAGPSPDAPANAPHPDHTAK